jgi:hypothetical protein
LYQGLTARRIRNGNVEKSFLKEAFMTMTTHTEETLVKGFENLNWVAADILPRDREQSHRLHEPAHLINTIDPINGRDLDNLAGHPSIVDGNLTIYFESETTRRAYQETPVDHPYERLPEDFPKEIDRGG